MSRLMALTLPIVVVFSASCGSTLQPGSWSQIHSDNRNTGFNAVHRALAGPQLKLWSAPVGQLSYSSPAIGPDGTVYIGNTSGQAVALNPDGTERWRRQLGSSIVATPAVHGATGEILFVVQNPLAASTYASFLYRLSPTTGTILTVSTEQNLVTSAAPKIWREFVILQTAVRYGQGETDVTPSHIYVYDRTTLQVVAKTAAPTCGHPICGSGFPIGPLLRFLLTCLPPFGLAQDWCYSFEGTPGPIEESSVAIVDARNAVDDPDRPTVLVATGFCAAALRFDPSAPMDERLQHLWGQKLVGDCDERARCTSPAMIAGTQALFGDHKGNVRSFDVRTGMQLWKRKLAKAVQSAPVGFLRQIYVVTEDKLIVLDSDGTPRHEVALRAVGRAAALALENVHVGSSAGIHSFTLNPQQASSFDGTIVGSGGASIRSIPALAANGRLYVSTSNGFVHAYAASSP